MADSIRLLGLGFHSILGDLPHEREVPQPIEVDVEISIDARPAAAADSVAAGLDYRAVYAAVEESVAADPERAPRLVETLCERIAAAVLALDGVDAVRVRVRKPWAALPGPARTVEVEVTRP